MRSDTSLLMTHFVFDYDVCENCSLHLTYEATSLMYLGSVFRAAQTRVNCTFKLGCVTRIIKFPLIFLIIRL